MHPIFNLYNERWPIRTATAPLPPAKFVEGGIAQDSIVGAGTIISGAIVRRSVISPNVRDRGRGRGVGLGGAARACGSAAARWCAGRSWTRTWWSPTARWSAWTSAADRARYTVSPGGVVVLGKGVTAL